MTLHKLPRFYYVYVLFSQQDKKLYVGYTTNLEKRLLSHSNGKVTSTQRRRPLVLIHYETFRSKSDALAREIFLKSGYGRNQLKKALKHDLSTLNYKHLS